MEEGLDFNRKADQNQSRDHQITARKVCVYSEFKSFGKYSISG